MLQALVEHGIVPDVLLGCSAGALNAAGFGSDPTPSGVRRMHDQWASVRGTDIFPGGTLIGPWTVIRKGRSIYPNGALREVIESWLPHRTFEESKIPLHVVATSLDTGRECWFSSGDLIEPLLASAAIPAVFPPVEIGSERFIDGGVVDNVPMLYAVALGARRIFVLHTGNFERRRRDPRRPLDVLVQAFSIARSYRFRQELEHVVPDGVELITLPGVNPGPLRYNDFSRSAELSRRSYLAASEFLDTRQGRAAAQ